MSRARHSDRPRSEIDGSACGGGGGGEKEEGEGGSVWVWGGEASSERRSSTLKYLDVSLTS